MLMILTPVVGGPLLQGDLTQQAQTLNAIISPRQTQPAFSQWLWTKTLNAHKTQTINAEQTNAEGLNQTLTAIGPSDTPGRGSEQTSTVEVIRTNTPAFN